MQSTIPMAVIGVGHFGRYHAEKIARLPGAELIAVVDNDEEQVAQVADKHGVRAVTDYRELFGCVNAVSLAVPTHFHFEIAKDLLEHGIDVLVEKPITPDVESAAELVAIAARNNRILQVGHLERFSGVVEAVRRHVTRPLYIDSVRIAPFKARSMDVNVILDLMIHDLDLILCILKSPIVSVDAAGAPVFSESEDIASVRIKFADGCIANIVASRISLKSERTMRIFERDRYLKIDLEKRTINSVSRRAGQTVEGLPGMDIQEENYSAIMDPLEREIDAFITAVRDRSVPMVSGEDGRIALEAASQVNDSLRAHAKFLNDTDQHRAAVAENR